MTFIAAFPEHIVQGINDIRHIHRKYLFDIQNVVNKLDMYIIIKSFAEKALFKLWFKPQHIPSYRRAFTASVSRVWSVYLHSALKAMLAWKSDVYFVYITEFDIAVVLRGKLSFVVVIIIHLIFKHSRIALAERGYVHFIFADKNRLHSCRLDGGFFLLYRRCSSLCSRHGSDRRNSVIFYLSRFELSGFFLSLTQLSRLHFILFCHKYHSLY